MSKKKPLGVIYSTNPDFNYKYENDNELDTLPPNRQSLKIQLDKKQRHGKKVTLIIGFIGKSSDLEALAKLLKTKCGSGGSVKDGSIIIQGDFCHRILQILSDIGYNSKLI